MENSDTIQEIEISTGRMVLKLLKLFLFSLIRLRFYVPGIPEIKVDNLYELIISDNAPLIIDTRDNSEFYGVADYGKNYGHIPGAKLLPLFQLAANLKHLSSFKDELIVTICPGGGASLIACEIMIEAGFTNVKSLRGGMNKWYKKGYPTTTAEDPDDLIYFVEKTAEVIDGKQTLDEAFTGEIHHSLDARGLSCPKPVLKSKKILEKLEINQVLEILTTDPGSKRDIPAWAHVTGQELISQEDRDTEDFRFLVKRLK
jgi:tRNA 2-thiouridine synthesizing protein A